MKTWSTIGIAVLGLAGTAMAQSAAPTQVPATRVPVAPVQAAPARPATVPLTPVVAAPAAAAPVTAAAPTQSDPALAPVAERLAGFVKEFNAKNVVGVVNYFTDDAALIDSEGVATRGKAAISDQFTAGFSQASPYTLESTIETGRFLTPDVAQLEGVSKLTAPNEPSVVNRFVALATKKDNVWRIAEIRDLPAPDADVAPADRLKELEWMVGDWVSESSDTKISSNVRWGDNKAFLVRTASSQVGNEKATSSLMIVGWDPTSSSIKSWLFDSNGGHGEGIWARASDTQWIIRASGVHADGTSASATQLLSLESKDALKTSTVDRISGGVVVPDTDEILMVRRPPAPAGAAPTAAPRR